MLSSQQSQQDDEINELVHWAMTHGIVMGLLQPKDGRVTHAPVTLRPYRYPATHFTQVICDLK